MTMTTAAATAAPAAERSSDPHGTQIITVEATAGSPETIQI